MYYHVFTYITLFWSRKTSVIVKTFQLSFSVFKYAFHLAISPFSRLSFPIFLYYKKMAVSFNWPHYLWSTADNMTLTLSRLHHVHTLFYILYFFKITSKSLFTNCSLLPGMNEKQNIFQWVLPPLPQTCSVEFWLVLWFSKCYKERKSVTPTWFTSVHITVVERTQWKDKI